MCESTLGRILRTAMPETASTPPSPASAGNPARASMLQLLRDAWQVPLLVLSVGAIGAAVWYSKANKVPNQWDETLAQAVEQIDKRELPIARRILDETIAPHLAEAPEGFVAKFELARADLASAELSQSSSPTKEAFAEVAARYEEATAKGATLDHLQESKLRSALVNSGREAEAIAAAEKSGDVEQARALVIRRGRSRLQEAYDALQGDADLPRVNEFFRAYEAFRGERRISAEDRAWAAALASRTSIAGGHPDESSTRLQREMRLAELAMANGETISPMQLAELGYLLGEGFRLQKEFIEAERELEHARKTVDDSSRLGGEIDLALGRVKLALGRVADAHAILDRAVLKEHPADIAANLRLARGQARTILGMDAEARIDFEALLASQELGKLSATTTSDLLRVLNELARTALGEEDFSGAIELAQLAKELDDRGPRGAETLITLAESAYRSARKMRDDEIERIGSSEEMERGMRADINIVFKLAAENYTAYLLTDAAKALPALDRSELHFSAADSFDCASEYPLALEHFEASIAELPERDSKRTERVLRIGDILFEEGQAAEALVAYQRASEASPNDPRVAMPRCRALAVLGEKDPGQRARALVELERVLGGEAGHGAESAQYREALDLSARLAFESGDFVRSAMRLTELLERDPDNADNGGRQFRLGESLQAISRAAGDEARKDDLTATRRAEVVRIGNERGADAQRAYQRAIDALEGHRRALESNGRKFKDNDKLRNAYVQRAQCAFDRGQFKESIDLLETIDRKFPDHAASLLALVQIVNAADALGETKRAETAHLRALRRIESLPESVLAEGSVFSRDEWKTWLRNHPPVHGAAAVAATEEERP